MLVENTTKSFMLGGSDVSYMMAGAKQRSAFLRSIPLKN
jgi:hypothetical protein